MYTKKCRAYWHAQNECNHEVGDWKFHVSVSKGSIKQAWNLLVDLLIDMQCRSGMKCVYLPENSNKQKGRQITIYIVKWHHRLSQTHFAKQYQLAVADEHSSEFWYAMFNNIQTILPSAGIQSNGLAQGDKPIGKYVSIRNQAYIVNKYGEYQYPPNDAGWNPLSQPLPFPIQPIQDTKNTKNMNKHRLYEKLGIIIIILLVLYYCLHDYEFSSQL